MSHSISSVYSYHNPMNSEIQNKHTEKHIRLISSEADERHQFIPSSNTDMWLNGSLTVQFRLVFTGNNCNRVSDVLAALKTVKKKCDKIRKNNEFFHHFKFTEI